MCALPNTLVELFRSRVIATPDAPALLLPKGSAVQTLTWREIARDVQTLAISLRDWDVKPGTHVAQISENRYEWLLADLSILYCGGVHVALSPQLPTKQLAAQIHATDCTHVLFSQGVPFSELRSLLRDDQNSSSAIRWCGYDRQPSELAEGNCSSWQVLLSHAAGDKIAAKTAAILDEIGHAIQPCDPATIIFTSGTMGEPVGVVLSHGALCANVHARATLFGKVPVERRLGWLPLAHLYARTADFYVWIARGSQLVLAESPERAFANAQATAPDFISGVPLFYDRILRYAESQRWPATEFGQRLRQFLGGNIRLLMAGGAPLPPKVRAIFHQHELPLLVGYGLTETGPIVSAETLDQQRPGSVGRPLPGVEVRIAADGEILVRSPGLFSSYWKQPALTAEKLRDGWLHTGDLGRLDADGFLWLTGRKKEVIVLASGHKVQPAAIEARFAGEPLIAQIVVVGEGQNCLGALIVPNCDQLRELLIKQGDVAIANDFNHPRVREVFRQRIEVLQADCAGHERIRRFTLLDRSWTAESGELTATLKVRRAVIQANFAAEIVALFAK